MRWEGRARGSRSPQVARGNATGTTGNAVMRRNGPKDEAGALIARLEDLAARRQELVIRLEAASHEWLLALRGGADVSPGPGDGQARRANLARTRLELTDALTETAAAQERLLEELDALIVPPSRTPAAVPLTWVTT
jgi:hypothetical protein